MDTQELPWNKLALNIVGPLERTSKKNKYILSCQDNLNKYLIAVPLQSQTAEEIAEKLIKFIINIWNTLNYFNRSGNEFLLRCF
jgi:hypothetical protein